MVVLGINTASNQVIVVSLQRDGTEDILEEKIGGLKTQIVLSLIDTLLAKHDLKVEDIERITVDVGPGSFTGLRVGIAIANTLGYILEVPVNGKKPGELVEPRYS